MGDSTTLIADQPETESLPPQAVERVRELYGKGLFLQAYQAALEIGPFETWTGTSETLLAARLCTYLAAPGRSDWLMRRAFRRDPVNVEAKFYYALRKFRRQGPYWAWRWMERQGRPPADTEAEHRAAWLALAGSTNAALRDFSVAEALLDEAVSLHSDKPYVHLCRASLLECEDRFSDALDVAQQVLETDPQYVQAVEYTGHLLTVLGRDEEAIDFLREAAARFESGALWGMLHAYYIEAKQYECAEKALDRWYVCSPLAEKRMKKWREGRLSDLAYYRGDYPAAICHAEACGHEFFKAVAQRLSDPARRQATRTELPVGFVRQHRSTCVPATLSAISRYWSKPADHVQLADEICYNGTSAYHERSWANRNGWATQEFTVTESAARELLERGVPFTFTSVEPGSAHLQAVIGYDGRRGTLFLREPSARVAVEGLADKIIERYRAFGPRGMALVPENRRSLLDGLALPDAAGWDLLHAFDGALVNHRREEARQILDRLEAEAPGTRIAHEARRRLAVYDANPAERLAAVESLMKLAPDDAWLQMDQLSCLRGLSKRDERLAIFEKTCAARRPQHVFLQQYADELRVDARRLVEACQLAERAVRIAPADGGNYYILGNVYWDQRRFSEAIAVYRFAACLNDKEEAFARAYFVAAQWSKKTAEAIDFLTARFRRYGSKSWLPCRTLAGALLHLNRTAEAFACIDEALDQHPEDGNLMLFAARTFGSYGGQHLVRAHELLAQAQAQGPRGEWLRVAAQFAENEGRVSAALEYWRALLELQPLAADAHASVATLLAEQQGKAAGLAYLEQVFARFPHNLPLSYLWAQRLHGEPASVREPLLRRIIDANPDDGWLRRELGFLLVDQRRIAEAWPEAELSLGLDPHESATHHLRSVLFKLEGRLPEAKTAMRRAIELAVDNGPASGALLGLCNTLAERREALDFIRDQLQRQVTFGDGLINFRELAHGILDAEALLTVLQDAVRERPDLWHAWSAAALQLMNMQRLDEAWQMITDATARYPLLPRLWLDQATIARTRRDAAAERSALETACQINPQYGLAVRALSRFLLRIGEVDASKNWLEQFVALSPLDAQSHAMLAETLWRMEQREAAIERMQRAVTIAPGYSEAWDRLIEWTKQADCRQIVLDAVRTLTDERGGETSSWLIAARTYNQADEVAQRLAALDKALELDPLNTDAHDLRVRSLAAAKRWDEAEAACRPAAFGGNVPVALRARGAWIADERGNRKRAIAEMRSVVAESPAMFEAWASLHEWCTAAKDAPGSLAAAEAMVRIAPHHGFSHSALGQARELADDRDGAIAAFRRALEIEPKDEFAGNSLFDLYMGKNDLKAAAEVLAAVEKHSQSGYVLSRAVQLASRQKNLAVAKERCTTICRTPLAHGGSVRFSIDAMVKAGWGREARQILAAAARGEDAHRTVPGKWARLCATADDGAFEIWIADRKRKGKRFDEAVHEYLDSLAHGKKSSVFRSFVAEHSPWLRASPVTWGAVTHGLCILQRYRDLSRWAYDWKDRTDLKVWMLVNAAEGYWATGAAAQAVAVSERALTIAEPIDHRPHYCLLAMGTMMRGDLAAARKHLASLKDRELGDDYKFIIASIEAVLKLDATPLAKRAKVFPAVDNALVEARKSYKSYLKEPARRRLYRSCLWHAARLRGGAATWLWFLRRWNNS